MAAAQADSLVLVFTEGMSLRAWRETGMLEREWALYEAMLEHYARVVLVTWGDAEDRAFLEPALSEAARAKVVVVSNAGGLPAREFGVASAPALVVEACAGSAGVVVKTNQMAAGDAAVQIVRALRESGARAALVARGGYLWTRFVAFEHGPNSPAALDAAAREKVLCQAADVVVGTTADMVEDLAWRYHLDPSRCLVIPNYVLVEGDPKPGSEREPGTVLYAGQLSARKRVDVLIRALATIPTARARGLKLEVIGDGPERRRLEELAAGLDAPVVFRPRVAHRDLLARMAACTVYAQASELEGHPKTVLEAMASGAPVLVAKSPGLMDVVTHGMNGLRVDATADAFANAIEELTRDEEWRDTLGAAAARTIRAQCGLDVVVAAEKAAHQAAQARQADRRSAA